MREPENEREILNHDIPKKYDQIWHRPEIKDVKRMSQRDRIEYIDLHRKRWHEGVYILINGELEYITGMHYDFLTFNKFDFGYAHYLDQQKLDFYFRDLVRKDINCFGKAILKCRRCGMTAEELEEAIYTLLEDEQSHIGLQSNEYKKCLQTLMYPLVQAYLSRPKWMREEFYSPGGKKPRNSLELISNRIDIINEADDEFLGGTIRPYPTTPAAMDGTKKRLIIQDESFKWVTASTLETLDINKKCVVEYGIKGKVDVLSTMGDSDDYVEAVKEGCQIIQQSNPLVRDANGRTTTGLYEWFVSAIHSADIPEEHRDPAYTRFGKINKDKAEAYVWAQVNKYGKDTKQYVFELRRMPLKKEHGLLAATDKTYFPVIRFDARLNELNSLPHDRKPYIRGEFVEDRNGKVSFISDAEREVECEKEGKEFEAGVCLVSLHPYFSREKNVDTRNRFRVSQNIYYPPVNPEFCAGYDPVRYKTDNTTSHNLSQAACVIYKKFDYYGAGDANTFACLILYRPNDPKDAHKKILLACKYYGAPLMAEKQVESTEDVAIEMNMLPFLMTNPDDGKWGLWSNPKRTENGLQELITLFSPPKEEVDKDMVAEYPFEVGIIDKKNFDLKNTEKSHITMAEIMLMHGLKQLNHTHMTDTTEYQMVDIYHEIIPKRR